MTNKEHLINRNIIEYESRLKHIDELLAKSENKAIETETQKKLRKIKEKREELYNIIHARKKYSGQDWDKVATTISGPMAIWDGVAQQLENLVEQIEHNEK